MTLLHLEPHPTSALNLLKKLLQGKKAESFMNACFIFQTWKDFLHAFFSSAYAVFTVLSNSAFKPCIQLYIWVTKTRFCFKVLIKMGKMLLTVPLLK